ncbi:hypothetical protein CKY39_07850 [Variovorax boronicumulans]|uniref:YqaJ viral recombinase domain-containing protein n=1 Tax=Variovorax boronicumulans TaxID=436515 RepID=A0A250DFV8_9BURK|nr:YqaJ viral recombinase family protein [Variovorax boronicumulans]ATA53132.1 hypothetical protein CKY39_07850 [Variovorax boronicumulans]
MVNTRSERLRTVRPSSTGMVAPRAGAEQQMPAETGIGAVDAAAALGLDPFKSRIQLWMEKTGRQGLLQPATVSDDVSPDAAGEVSSGSPAYWSRLLEQILAAHYMHRTGCSVRHIQTPLQHPQHAFMLAGPRREVVGASGALLLECLSVGMSAAPAWAQGVPAHVRVKIVHLLAVTGAHAVDVLVLIAGQELQLHRMERNDTEIAWLIEQEAMFWRGIELDQSPPTLDENGRQADLWPAELAVSVQSPERTVSRRNDAVGQV